jgi:hypothetical protein
VRGDAVVIAGDEVRWELCNVSESQEALRMSEWSNYATLSDGELLGINCWRSLVQKSRNECDYLECFGSPDGRLSAAVLIGFSHLKPVASPK